MYDFFAFSVLGSNYRCVRDRCHLQEISASNDMGKRLTKVGYKQVNFLVLKIMS